MPRTNPTLDVWLYGTRIGVLTDTNRRHQQIRLDFTEAAEDRFGPGSLVLSCSMPLGLARRPNGSAVRSFFSGLLPEGEARQAAERRFAVTPGDTFGLLEAIGRDCAGAVSLLSPGSASTELGVGPALEVLGAGALEKGLAELEDHPLGIDEKVRVSLPGVQDKLLLAKTPDGAWARPVAGRPTTHILKPERASLPGYAAGEAFCLGLARDLGLTTVEAEVIEAGGAPVLVVARYDRVRKADGTVTRLHQEDLAQALVVDVVSGGAKYEADGGKPMRDVARLLTEVASPNDLRNLLRAAVLNVVVGNADAHAKNLSLLHPPDGSISLASLYDVTPTTFYRQVPTSRGLRDLDDTMGMFVGGKRSVHEVTREDLVAEGRSWGLLVAVAEELVEETLDTLGRVLSGEADRAATVPEAMLGFVVRRQEALVAGKPASYGERSSSLSL